MPSFLKKCFKFRKTVLKRKRKTVINLSTERYPDDCFKTNSLIEDKSIDKHTGSEKSLSDIVDTGDLSAAQTKDQVILIVHTSTESYPDDCFKTNSHIDDKSIDKHTGSKMSLSDDVDTSDRSAAQTKDEVIPIVPTSEKSQDDSIAMHHTTEKNQDGLIMVNHSTEKIQDELITIDHTTEKSHNELLITIDQTSAKCQDRLTPIAHASEKGQTEPISFTGMKSHDDEYDSEQPKTITSNTSIKLDAGAFQTINIIFDSLAMDISDESNWSDVEVVQPTIHTSDHCMREETDDQESIFSDFEGLCRSCGEINDGDENDCDEMMVKTDGDENGLTDHEEMDELGFLNLDTEMYDENKCSMELEDGDHISEQSTEIKLLYDIQIENESLAESTTIEEDKNDNLYAGGDSSSAIQDENVTGDLEITESGVNEVYSAENYDSQNTKTNDSHKDSTDSKTNDSHKDSTDSTITDSQNLSEKHSDSHDLETTDPYPKCLEQWEKSDKTDICVRDDKTLVESPKSIISFVVDSIKKAKNTELQLSPEQDANPSKMVVTIPVNASNQENSEVERTSSKLKGVKHKTDVNFRITSSSSRNFGKGHVENTPERNTVHVKTEHRNQEKRVDRKEMKNATEISSFLPAYYKTDHPVMPASMNPDAKNVKVVHIPVARTATSFEFTISKISEASKSMKDSNNEFKNSGTEHNIRIRKKSMSRNKIRDQIKILCPECMMQKTVMRRRVPSQKLNTQELPKYFSLYEAGKKVCNDPVSEDIDHKIPNENILIDQLVDKRTHHLAKTVKHQATQTVEEYFNYGRALKARKLDELTRTPVPGIRRPNDYVKRAISSDLKKKFNRDFLKYAKNGRSIGDLISCKNSTKWLKDAGIVYDIKTEKEAEDTFKFYAGMKITLNKVDYKKYLSLLAHRKKLQYDELYVKLCNHARTNE